MDEKSSEDFQVARGHMPSLIWQSNDLFESNYFRIGQACSSVNCLLYGIRYAFLSRHEIGQERRQARVRESPQALRQHATGKAPFNPDFSASLIILVVIILLYLE